MPRRREFLSGPLLAVLGLGMLALKQFADMRRQLAQVVDLRTEGLGYPRIRPSGRSAGQAAA